MAMARVPGPRDDRALGTGNPHPEMRLAPMTGLPLRRPKAALVGPGLARRSSVRPRAIAIAILLHGVAITLLLLGWRHAAPPPAIVTLSLVGPPSDAAKPAAAAPVLPPVAAPAPATAAARAPPEAAATRAPPEAPAVPAPAAITAVPPSQMMQAAPEAMLAPVAPPPPTEARPLPERLPLPLPARPPPPAQTAAAVRPQPLPRPAPTAQPLPPARLTATEALSSAPSAVRAAFPAPGAVAAVNSYWSAAVSAWLDAHKVYPDLARRRGEQGTVSIRFTVTRDGRVLSAAVLHGSGSNILDRAAQTLLNGAQLPPFPPSMEGVEASVTAPIRYVLQP